MSISGLGTQESPYIISGETIKEVWEDMLLKIKENNKYVILDKPYVFNIDNIYSGSTIPKELKIGYNTTLDCKKSSIVSEKYGIEDFDFIGDRAEIYGLTMPGSNVLNQCSGLYIADSFERFITVSNEQHYNDDRNDNKNIRARIKLSKKIIVDLNNFQDDVVYNIYSGDIQFNGLTIQNGRNVRLHFKNSNSNNGSNKTIFSNLNLLDNIEFDRAPLLEVYSCVFYKCRIKHFAKHTGGCYLFASYDDYITRSVDFVSSSLELSENLLLYGYNGSKYAPGVFKDCVMYLNSLKNSIITGNNTYNNCYVYGKTEQGGWLFDTNINFDNIKQLIIEAETSQSINITSGGSASGVVINRTLAPNITTSKGGIYFLTTEEIRNPQKLYSSGIPIDPQSAAG